MKTIKTILIAFVCYFSVLAVPAFATNVEAATTKSLNPNKDDVIAFIVGRAERYADKAEEVAGKAVDFAKKEVPQVINEYLRWKMVDHIFSIAYPMFFLIVSFTTICLFYKKADTDNPNFHLAVTIAGCVGTLIFSIHTLLSLFYDLPVILQIWLAPRVYLLERINDFIR